MMAKERMVTRTIATTTASVLCVNVEKKEVETREFKVSKLQSDRQLLMSIQKALPKNIKAVTITGTKDTEVLYGMPENEFIKLAKVLEGR